MSYQVLARKWRPKTFSSVVGQSHVVRVLQNALRLDRTHHAYLFVGTRGVGKTTLARIFAKCLNCETGINDNPCGQCSACIQVDQGSFVDLIEVDAASRTGVDDMRELLETVQYAPNTGRFKIYLIDEVHMLSTSSFNALLKTLEEPPSHIKFFFATTDPKKLPVTILSRCLKLNLTRLSTEEIETYLTDILQQEGVQFEAGALKQLCVFAEGSVRDALSLLDQAIAYGNGSLISSEVDAMLGVVDYGHTVDILRCVISDDAEGLYKKIDDLYAIAVDFNIVLNDLIALLNEVAVQQALPGLDEAGSLLQFKKEDIKELADRMTPEEAQLFYQIAIHGKRDLPLLPDTKAAFRMTMLRMLAFRPVAADSGVSVSQTPVAAPTPQAARTSAKSPAQAASAAPQPDLSEKAKPVLNEEKYIALSPFAEPNQWIELINQLGIRGPAQEICRNGILDVKDENTALLIVDEQYSMLSNDNREEEIRQAFEQFFGRRIKINFCEAKPDLETPQQTQQRKDQQIKLQADESIKNDAFVKGLQDNFDAEIIPGSIKPVKADTS